MLNKMSILLAGVALAMTAGAANADNFDHNRDRGHTTVAVDLGGIAFGFNDGYWDNGHHWHHWRNRHEMRRYRGHNHDGWHDYNHDRDSNQGWNR